MKKILLACSLVVSSIFFAYAQFDAGGVEVNVGNVCKTIEGQKKVCLNASTGAWEEVADEGKTVTGIAGDGGSAVQDVSGGVLTTLLNKVLEIVQVITPVLINLTPLFVFFLIVLYVKKGKDMPEEKKKGRLWPLLALLLLFFGSGFLAYAQFNLGGVNVNVGQLCKTEGQKKLCFNPSTGEWLVTDGDGVIGGNTNTGAIGGSGSINGIGINGGYSGTQQGGLNTTSGLGGILGTAQGVLRFLVPFLITLALLAFFWYIILYIWKGKDDPSAYAKGKVGMFYSLLALFIMVSVWGIITFFGQIIGIGQGGTMTGFKIPGKE